MGFWVATTMNGRSRTYVTPSTVTCRSSIASSSADCVFGDARLISSPTTMLANTAPGLNSNSRRTWSKTDTPVTSLGSRSGVNCTRRTVQSIERASALASIVLPTPGTSSMSRWPSASSTTSARRTTSGLPSTTCSMLSRIRPADSCRTSRSAPTGAALVGGRRATWSSCRCGSGHRAPGPGPGWVHRPTRGGREHAVRRRRCPCGQRRSCFVRPGAGEGPWPGSRKA